jgi:hypothetical protein
MYLPDPGDWPIVVTLCGDYFLVSIFLIFIGRSFEKPPTESKHTPHERNQQLSADVMLSKTFLR